MLTDIVRQRFVWDPNKARSNERKHGIPFEAALLVFAGPLVLIEQDRVEGGEYRWQALGMVRSKLLVVAHTVWELGDVEIVRIISARLATRRERQEYEQAGHRNH